MANTERALTRRELEVLRALAAGLTYKEIAERLGISIDTVRAHVRQLYPKLGVRSRTEAAVKFLQTAKAGRGAKRSQGKR